MTDKIPSKTREALLEAERAIDAALKSYPEFELGKLPNRRGGFFHNHSASYECGIAYYDQPQGDEGSWKPCRKLVNHKGKCGFEDNTAF